jgi:hypothetical protein
MQRQACDVQAAQQQSMHFQLPLQSNGMQLTKAVLDV